MCLLVDSAAQCVAGQEPKADNTGCQECAQNFYKDAAATTADWRAACTPCAAGKETISTGATLDTMCLGEYQTNHVMLVAKIFDYTHDQIYSSHNVFKQYM